MAERLGSKDHESQKEAPASEHDGAEEKRADPRVQADAAQAATRRMAGVEPAGPSTLPANTAPWEKEVHGIPANAVARKDDEEQMVTETTVAKNKGSFEKKKYEKATAGTAKFDHTKTTTVQEGEEKDVHAASTTGTASLAKGVEIGRSHSDETSVGEDVSTKNTHSKAIGGDLHGGHVKMGHETEAKVGENKITSGRENSLGVKDGKLEAEHSTTNKVEDANGAHSTTKKISYGDGKVKRGWGEEKETKRKVKEVDHDGVEHEVEKTSKRGKDTSVAIGTEGAAVDRSWSNTNEKGTTRSTNVGAEFDKDGNASVSAGHSVSDKDGNSFKVSGKAGIEVYASEPEKHGNRWVVTYKRTKSLSAGAGGSYKGMGANAGVSKSGFEDGTRSFKTKEEAAEFREHAGERIKDAVDPTTVEGALSLEVGESRGTGGAIEGSLGGSASFEGATAGVSGHDKKTEEVDVRRVSGTVVEATYMKASEKGVDLEGGGYGVTANAGHSSNKHSAVTVRFDLGTSEGKAAFEKFGRDHQVPARGGKVVSTDDGKGEESHDGMKIAGMGSAKYGQHTSEDTTVDEDGKHERYQGDNTHDVNTTRLSRFLGDKDLHSSVEIVSRQENDKAAGYSVEGKFSGDSGTHNRAQMRHLMGIEENFDESKVDKGHSGEWTMSAELSAKAIAAVEKYDDRYKGLKNDDDKMRALAQAVAEHGGNAINHFESMGGKSLTWDVELKGDKNFPGREGRVLTEQKIRQFGAELAANPGSGPTVAGQVQAELDALKARRHAVADPKKYLDLPDALRNQQLAGIDAEIGSLESLRHQATVEAVKNNPGEKLESIQKRHFIDKHGYDGLNAEQKQVATTRDEIAETDAMIVSYDGKIGEAHAAIVDAAQHHMNFSRASSERIKKREDNFKAGLAIAEAHRLQYRGLDEQRMTLLHNSGDPKVALQIAQAVQAQLKAQLNMVGTAYMHLEKAAVAQLGMNKAGNMGKFAAFWADIAENSVDGSDVAVEDDRPSSSDRDDDEPKSKPKHTSMALPGR